MKLTIDKWNDHHFQRVLNETLSQYPTGREVDLDEVVVKLLWREGRAHWQINQREYNRLADVQAVLTAAARVQVDLPVILDVDPEVPMEDVIDVYDLCRRVGLVRIQFAASSDA